MPSLPQSFLRPLGVYGYDAVEPLVLAALVTEDPLLLIGRHGTGKTFLLNSLSEALLLEHRHYNASLIAFDDLVGFPFPNAEKTEITYLPTPATVWTAESVLVDELNRCRPEHQNRFFSLIHERRLQGLPLPRLRYRWAAMNPAGDEHGYGGTEALDPALADRFAFLLTVADWGQLSEEDQAAVADPRGDGARSDDGGCLRAFLDDARHKFEALRRDPPGTTCRYAVLVANALASAGLLLSPRRVRQLTRNLLAVEAVLGAPTAVGALATLSASLPQRAGAEPMVEATVQAAHQIAWAQVHTHTREAWLLRFQLVKPLPRKLEILLQERPVPEMGDMAIAQLLHEERPIRAVIFASALLSVVLEDDEAPFTEESRQQLVQRALPGLDLRGPIEHSYGARANDGATPGLIEALERVRSWSELDQQDVRPLLYHTCQLCHCLPRDWEELLREYLACLATVRRLRPSHP